MNAHPSAQSHQLPLTLPHPPIAPRQRSGRASGWRYYHELSIDLVDATAPSTAVAVVDVHPSVAIEAVADCFWLRQLRFWSAVQPFVAAISTSTQPAAPAHR